ncbi:MAG: hypothetical protein WDZ35_08910 [Crocinitomicaceae bacterium]
MSIITKTEVKELAQIRKANCVSIYIPTHRFGEPTLEGKDALQLKNQLKAIKQKLTASGMHADEADRYLKPASDLLKDSEFWRNQSDGLAIFIAEGVFQKYTLPIHFEAFNYLSEEFYLKPLMPFFNDNGRFFLLNLQPGNIKFYSGNQYSITEIDLQDDLPERLEDVVGYDYEQKTLQFRTQQGGLSSTEGHFHGHSDENSDRKDELLRYFQVVNEGVMNLLNDKNKEPLLVACVDYHFPIYREANTYLHLYPDSISKTLRDVDVYLLHEHAWKILSSHFEKHKNHKLNQFNEFQGTGKTSRDIRQIISAAENGKIDALFLENRADILGNYDPKNHEIHLNGESDKKGISLMNLVAMKVFEQGGEVYLLDKKDMPNESSKVNALYRY